MIIIHAMNNPTLPRLAVTSLKGCLSAMPAVVLTGARQTGKSTIAKELLAPNRDYYTLDDLEILDLARRVPEQLLAGKRPITLDEIQREPSLLPMVKLAIDQDRSEGRFLLTGSANLALMEQVSESLAGRASYLTLWPMTRREQLGLGSCGHWEALFQAKEEDWKEVLEAGKERQEDWRGLAQRGGFPTPAVHMHQDEARRIWFDGYLRTYLERDLQALSAISSLPDFRRLMKATCLRLGQLTNQTELGRDVGLPQATVHRYLNLLEMSYMLIRLPAFAVNRTKRLIKSPKCYWGDLGLALFLTGESEPSGAHLENLILLDLLTWRDASLRQVEICYWRTTNGEEVDFVVDTDGKLLPIEVKATRRPTVGDAKHLLRFQQEYGPQATAGLLLHGGEEMKWLAPRILAVPWWRMI
jgi:uncharacterized protein